LLKLAKEEKKALKHKKFKINTEEVLPVYIPKEKSIPDIEIINQKEFNDWLKTNTFPQKQEGFYAITIRLQTGDIDTARFRKLASLVKELAGDDVRITVNQGLLIKFVREHYLKYFYQQLKKLGLADPGFNSTADITTCPGTDTCNLGIASSTDITRELERVIKEEYPDLIYNSDIKIKISGCMNSCGHHAIANIGFHGSTIRVGKLVVPAMLVLMGGGSFGAGEGSIAEKLIKVPSKRGPEVLRLILNDYQENTNNNEIFNDYYRRKGKDYFYHLILHLADVSKIQESDFIDWGHTEKFETAIGVGECAGVTIDLITTLFLEVEEKLENSLEALQNEAYADAVYFSYSAFINAAKAMLLSEDVSANTQAGIIRDFDEHFIETMKIPLTKTFASLVYQIKEHEPTAGFAGEYLRNAKNFYQLVNKVRENQLVNAR